MAEFISTTGRVWYLDLSVDLIDRVRRRLKVDLYAATDHEFRDLLALLDKDERFDEQGQLTGPMALRFIAVLHLVCAEQLVAERVSAFDFGRGLWGALDDARTAFIDAVIDFFSGDPARQPPPDAPKVNALTGAEWEQEAWRLAGIVGVHPGPYKLRELRRMAEGRMRHEWRMTASQIAVNVNLHSTGDKQYSADDFDPFFDPTTVADDAPAVDEVAWKMLKAAFVKEPACNRR